VSGYTKLFAAILDSTVWRAENPTRLVFITMLAMCDRFGCIEASIPGLADRARVSLEECEKALASLQSPDPYSRSKDLDGRRITPIDGGWQLVNYEKYRKILSEDERRAYLRQKQQEYRDRVKARVNTALTNVNNVSDTSTPSTQALPSPSPSPSPEGSRPRRPTPRAARSATAPDQDFEKFWKSYPKRTGKAAARAAWATAKPGLATVLAALEWQTRRPEWTSDAGRFIPHPGTWLRQERWNDEPIRPTDQALPEDGWRAECQTQHGGRCASRYVHGQMRGATK
jgi:hypothetical protein